ncbi:MAG: 50S ribosomal protein L22 [Planctomycetes bacterium]|jgi:large subunit ribosomal protein L22|nr:50S ribosomal protein L22 [Planctomycetota bacterium]MDP6410336.1 50S ribosomal protein L22 [Planctomycetota bacterium]
MDATDSVTTARFTARHRYARLTARKARLVADQIRGMSANAAIELLEFSPKRAGHFYLKLLRSAMANASQSEDVNLNRLTICDCRADDGPMLQNRLRWRAGPQGRAMPFAKKTSHLTVTVCEQLSAAAAPIATEADEISSEDEE